MCLVGIDLGWRIGLVRVVGSLDKFLGLVFVVRCSAILRGGPFQSLGGLVT